MGFIGSGSLNQASTLQPSEIRTLTLHAFTQDIQQTSYAVTFSLLTDNATDSVPLTLTIRRLAPDVRFEQVSVDPNTRITQARLTNYGPTVTDLDFDVLDAGGLPANVSILPDLHHVYLPTGASIEFQIIPLELTNTAGGFTPLPAGPQLVSLVKPPQGTTRPATMQTTAGPFTGKICMMSGYCVIIASVSDNHCSVGLTAFSFTVNDPITTIANSSAWYCTNKPNIDVAMRPSISIPPNASILSVSVSADFTPSGGEVYSHAVELLFNNVFMGGATVPDQSRLTLPVSPSAWVAGATQTINLRSVHPYSNLSHYVVANNFTMTVQASGYTANICALNEQDARNRLGIGLAATPTPTPPPLQSYVVGCANRPDQPPFVKVSDAPLAYGLTLVDFPVNNPTMTNYGYAKAGTLVTIQSPAVAQNAYGYIWYRVSVPKTKLFNQSGIQMGTTGESIGWMIASTNMDPIKGYLLDPTTNCLPPTPTPTPTPVGSLGQQLCTNLTAKLRNEGRLPSEVGANNLKYFETYPTLNNAAQFTNQFGYPPILTYTKPAGADTYNNLVVVPCYYDIDGTPATRIVRFATNADANSSQDFLKEARYRQILNYANYYATGPLDGPRDWCFPGDTLYNTFYERATLLYDDGSRYNLPVPGVNCGQRGPNAPTNGNGPCGTLPSAVFRALGYFNLSSFNPPPNVTPTPLPPNTYAETYQLGKWYWGPAGYIEMFKHGKKYVKYNYSKIHLDFKKADGSTPEFSENGWNVHGDEANWASYDINQAESTTTWDKIKPGDIVTTFTLDHVLIGTDKYLETARFEPSHVQLVVGWGPNISPLSSWKQTYDGTLYSTWDRIPEDRRDQYVPYVIDRGSRFTPNGEDYAMRGPRPFHSQYSISYLVISVANEETLTP